MIVNDTHYKIACELADILSQPLAMHNTDDATAVWNTLVDTFLELPEADVSRQLAYLKPVSQDAVLPPQNDIDELLSTFEREVT
jgi:hypothetical protein